LGRRIGAAEHFARACAAAPGLVAEAGLVRVELSRRGFTQVHGIEKPNPLQASIMEELPRAVAGGGAGILVVTAATGDGKTETALEAERILAQAAGTAGLCFVLPTMATSDEMYKRVAAVVAAQVPHEADTAVAVTLTHSMAWLNEAYSDEDLGAAGDDVVSDEEPAPGGGGDGVRGTLPGRWLRGAKRPLLAQFAVGTIDQSLLGVLPVRHNALRLLALSGKTFVVDEAHAYDPYMQVLLSRLLQWLGAYRCPVVLLSATLPSSVGERLVRAYLEGTKQVSARELQRMSFRSPYPGWLFVDATGKSTVISKGRQEEQSAERRYRLGVDVRRVRHLPEPRDGSALPDDARLAVLEEVLNPLAAGAGCAAVVCTTVADAQETYAFLKRRFDLKPGEEIVLLHARFPGDQRERATRTVVQALGRTGRRPDRMVVVATQVIEQSLDLDADLVVSDLAPIAQLLQRAGRCWRHEQAWARSGKPRERPAWTAGVPRLVVLDPLGKDRVPPKHWGTVYPHYLLSATSDCLHALADDEPARDGEPGRPGNQPQHRWIDIPEHVQALVEEVHGTESRFEAETETLQHQLTEHQVDTMAQQHIGEWAAVPGPWRVGGLHDLHRETLDEVEAATRLGAESVRVLGCYRHPDGRTTLDPQGEHPLPQATAGRFSAQDVRAGMRRTLPVRADLFKGRTAEQNVPTSWNEHPLLGDLLLLTHPVVEGQVEGVRIGSAVFRLDPELGLVHLRD
jgi:CRISPR-associated endonuclease/helicase Cas3